MTKILFDNATYTKFFLYYLIKKFWEKPDKLPDNKSYFNRKAAVLALCALPLPLRRAPESPATTSLVGSRPLRAAIGKAEEKDRGRE